MKILFLNILFLLIINYTFSQTENTNEKLEIWTMFSTGNIINENAHKFASEKWPFSTKSLTGCTGTEQEIDSIENHNQKIWEYLDNNGYVNSKKLYQQDFQIENNRIKKAIDLSKQNSDISNLYENIRKLKLENYTKITKINDKEYKFTVFSYSLENLNKPEKVELTFIAEIERNKITIME